MSHIRRQQADPLFNARLLLSQMVIFILSAKIELILYTNLL